MHYLERGTDPLIYDYSAPQWLLIFYLYCFLGWCFESTVVSVQQRRFVNRGFSARADAADLRFRSDHSAACFAAVIQSTDRIVFCQHVLRRPYSSISSVC